MLETYDKKIQSFFEDNQKILQKYYSGLNKDIFNRVVSDFLFKNGSPKQDCLRHSLYIKSFNYELERFFTSVLKGIPFEYILNEKFFYKNNFYVNESVLIPRSETEILVEKACIEVKNFKKDRAVNIVDVGTGSGAIILSILIDCHKSVKFNAFSTDISKTALEVAKINSYRLRFQLGENILQFKCTDRLEGFSENYFDFIVSNPPYIKTQSDLGEVHQQVYENEPHEALFIEDKDYEKWFSEFFRQIQFCLRPNGLAIIEGHENHLENLKKLAIEFNLRNVSLIKDYTNRNRFIIFSK